MLMPIFSVFVICNHIGLHSLFHNYPSGYINGHVLIYILSGRFAGKSKISWFSNFLTASDDMLLAFSSLGKDLTPSQATITSLEKFVCRTYCKSDTPISSLSDGTSSAKCWPRVRSYHQPELLSCNTFCGHLSLARNGPAPGH